MIRQLRWAHRSVTLRLWNALINHSSRWIIIAHSCLDFILFKKNGVIWPTTLVHIQKSSSGIFWNVKRRSSIQFIRLNSLYQMLKTLNFYVQSLFFTWNANNLILAVINCVFTVLYRCVFLRIPFYFSPSHFLSRFSSAKIESQMLKNDNKTENM